jgi:hypothetical protein
MVGIVRYRGVCLSKQQSIIEAPLNIGNTYMLKKTTFNYPLRFSVVEGEKGQRSVRGKARKGDG